MGKIVPEAKKGVRIAAWAKAIVQLLGGMRPVPSRDLLPVENPDGSFSFRLRRRGTNTTQADPYHMPFDGYLDDTGETPVVKVKPGKINGEYPTQVGTSASWTYATAAGYVVLKAVITKATGELTTREIRYEEDVPTDSEDSTTVTTYLELFQISGSGDPEDPTTITPAYNGSRWVSLAISNIVCSAGGLELTHTVRW